jgi:hypothetical protein
LVTCRCEVLNVMSGAVATDYARTHLDTVRSTGNGRVVYRCPETDIGWTQERAVHGIDDQTIVLRRDVR